MTQYELDALPERIRSKCQMMAEHWEWTGAKRSGHGCVQWDGKVRSAAEVVWAILVGPLPAETRIQRLCDLSSCVYPGHLELRSWSKIPKRGRGQCSVIEDGVRCTGVLECKGLCTKHYSRLRIHGSTEDPHPNLSERFWSKVDIGGPSECWEWIASTNAAGYGQFHMGGHNGRPEIASRMALALSGTEVPRGLSVCHHCDNRRCVNPAHLYVGTDADNTRDKVERNRVARGDSLPHTRLTEADVRDIRRLAVEGATQRAIAERFGVSRGAINSIVLRKNWKYVA